MTCEPTLPDEALNRETSCAPRRRQPHPKYAEAIRAYERREARWWYAECHAYIGSYAEAFENLGEAGAALCRAMQDTRGWRGLTKAISRLLDAAEEGLRWVFSLYGFK